MGGASADVLEPAIEETKMKFPLGEFTVGNTCRFNMTLRKTLEEKLEQFKITGVERTQFFEFLRKRGESSFADWGAMGVPSRARENQRLMKF